MQFECPFVWMCGCVYVCVCVYVESHSLSIALTPPPENQFRPFPQPRSPGIPYLSLLTGLVLSVRSNKPLTYSHHIPRREREREIPESYRHRFRRTNLAAWLGCSNRGRSLTCLHTLRYSLWTETRNRRSPFRHVSLFFFWKPRE